MKATGIVRNMDTLGRLVIPMEIRRELNINNEDPIEIYMGENKEIILKPYAIHCTFCDESNKEKLIQYNDKLVCVSCVEKLKDKGVSVDA